jgi:hypothetical protein
MGKKGKSGGKKNFSFDMPKNKVRMDSGLLPK